jgi:hypothetical protein
VGLTGVHPPLPVVEEPDEDEADSADGRDKVNARKGWGDSAGEADRPECEIGFGSGDETEDELMSDEEK